MRIVSLIPSATEIVSLLGLKEQLVGVSHECDYPASVQRLPKVTRSRIPASASSSEIDSLVREQLATQPALYDLDREQLERLEPDLIITQSLCNVCAVAEEEVLEAAMLLPSAPLVLQLQPMSLENVMESVRQVGAAAGAAGAAAQAVAALRARVDAVRSRSQKVAIRPVSADSPAAVPPHQAAQMIYRQRVVMLEWIDPPYSAGHWNPELIQLAGGEELLGRSGAPSRAIDWEEIVDADPDVLLIACCGYSIDRTLDDLPRLVSYRGFAKLRCIQAGRVFLVDGSAYFNRPGPRLVDSLELLAHTLHPELHPLPNYLEPAVRMKPEPKPGT
jgi:iron complex transport system substrate-binding protein